MSVNIIKAWKDADYRNSLSTAGTRARGRQPGWFHRVER